MPFHFLFSWLLGYIIQCLHFHVFSCFVTLSYFPLRYTPCINYVTYKVFYCCCYHYYHLHSIFFSKSNICMTSANIMSANRTGPGWWGSYMSLLLLLSLSFYKNGQDFYVFKDGSGSKEKIRHIYRAESEENQMNAYEVKHFVLIDILPLFVSHSLEGQETWSMGSRSYEKCAVTFDI